MKKKNDPYNLKMRLTHKDQLYWENQTSIRCENHHNMLALFERLEKSLTFSPLLSYTMKHNHTSQKETMARGWERDDWTFTSTPALGVLFIEKLMTKLLLWSNTTKTVKLGRRVLCNSSHRPVHLWLHLHVTSMMMSHAPSALRLCQSWG
jgi:hypothetical protein